MRRKTVKRIAALSALLIPLSVALFLAWVVATNQGSRWLFSSLSTLSHGAFSVRDVRGRLLDHLLLRGLKIAAGGIGLSSDRLELCCTPLLLVTGTLAVNELTLSGVVIDDRRSPSTAAPRLGWPKVSEAARLLEGRVGRLRIADLVYRVPGELPLRLNSASASLSWQNDRLSLTDLRLTAPSGRLSGTLTAGFGRSLLRGDLALAPARPLLHMDDLSLRLDCRRGRGEEQLTGPFSISGARGGTRRLELGGELGMVRTGFNLRRLRLTVPGRAGRLSGDGSLTLTPTLPVVSLRLAANGVDLAHELNTPTDISGVLTFLGTPESYRGDLTLSNRGRGWRAATLSAGFRGTGSGLRLAPLSARLLEGSVSGNLELGWREGLRVVGTLSGRALNPARIAPDWSGRINFDARGGVAWSGAAPPRGSVALSLPESRLHGRTLSGELRAQFGDRGLDLERCLLRGKGFDLAASGRVNRRIDFEARVSDLSRLLPGSSGSLTSAGWLRWRERQLTGELSTRGRNLTYEEMRLTSARLDAALAPGSAHPLRLSAVLGGMDYARHRLDSVTLRAEGTLPRHTLAATLRSAGAEANLSLTAGYAGGTWKGEIGRLSGRDGGGPWRLTAPAVFAVDGGRIALFPLALASGAEERLTLSADLSLAPLRGRAEAQWSGLKLARINPLLEGMRLSGDSRGLIRIGFLDGDRLSLSGNLVGSGIISGRGGSFGFTQGRLDLQGGEGGVRATLDLDTEGNGKMTATFSSTPPLKLALPERGRLTARLSAIDPLLFKPWLPSGLALQGRLSGRLEGNTLPGGRFELLGDASLGGGRLVRTSPEGELDLSFQTAALGWEWKGESLSGSLALALAGHGRTRTEFRLPIPARLPLAVDRRGPLRATLTGRFQEKGVLSSLLPGLVQESFAELEGDLTVGGSWGAPTLGGTLSLARAGAYLPSAGIRLKEVQLRARLAGNRISVDSFRALSGPGHLEGTAIATLDGWRVTGYRGTIGGERFQTVFLPELQLNCTPRLSFEGTPRRMTLRGELRLPDVRITGTMSNAGIRPSGDVILEGSGKPAERSSPLVLDGLVRVQLGERVDVKLGGIDARLGGTLDLTLDGLDRISSSGEIKVIKGRYRTYGVNLDLVRGRLFFAGGPIDRPSLDFLALRSIGDVKAGVTVTGTLRKPVTRLYSEPAMPDIDVLSYIVLGHPLAGGGEQAGVMTQAAGALLGSSQAALVMDQIKSRLGLSTLEVQKKAGNGTAPMGYRPIRVSNIESAATEQQNGIAETMLTVGKYLTPQLYVSYGNSLFTGASLFRLRYDLSRRWQVETQTGSESGVDIFYKLEFK